MSRLASLERVPRWGKPWFLLSAGWRSFFAPAFILPTSRQKPLTAAIHFGLGLPALLLALPRALRPRQQAQNILFAGRCHLGDFLLTLPALRLAREHLPDAKMTVVVQEKYRHHLDLSEIGFQTLPEIEGLKFGAEVRAWRQRLREDGYDAVVFHRITRPDFPAVIAAFLENIPHRVGGAEKGLQALLTDLYCPTARERVVEYHWNLVRAWLRLPPAAVELRWPRVVKLPKVEKHWDLLIAPFAQHTKEWPAENWHALLAYAREKNLRVALSAAPSQADRASQLLTNFPEVANLAQSSTTMHDLFTHVSETRCVIAVDTGIRHVAAALGIPCVVIGHGREHHQLFGAYVPTERYLFHPVPCAPCGAEPCPLGHLQCVRGISVESVLTAWKSLVPASSVDGAAPSPAATGFPRNSA